MANVHDVAAYILAKLGGMPAMRLQKLVYYCQAWHLVWDEEPLFNERIEAWANGPVVRELYDVHRGQFSVDAWPTGDPVNLQPAERETVDVVADAYGRLHGRHLSHLTHAERPWRDARAGLGPTDVGHNEITADSMRDYYSAVDAADDATPVNQLGWDRTDACAAVDR